MMRWMNRQGGEGTHLKNVALFVVSALVAFVVAGYGSRLLDRDPKLKVQAPESGTTRSGRETLPATVQATVPQTESFPLPQAAQTPPLKITETLSAFQQAALRAPEQTGRLTSELITSSQGPYRKAQECYEGPDESVLGFEFRVRSRGLAASVLGSRFAGVKRGAPVEPQVIACITRALNEPAEIRTDGERPFPEALEAEIAVEIALHGISRDSAP